MSALDALIDEISDLKDWRAEQERKSNNYVRKVRMKERKDGKVIVEDGSGFVSGPVTQASMTSGEWTIDAPANPGAQGFLICPDGETEGGAFFPCLPNDNHPHASTEQGTLRLKGPAGAEIEIAGGVATLKGVKVVIDPETHLAGKGGPAVARVGDMVDVKFGSSKGLHPIIQGSSKVFAN
ncbi:hypothetical protein SAMN04515647_1616 [Cohaesibacter sp. ES.047]|uniref:hypothetical protein n=1 Tax=Cohaesibacter sp. ES.047 TaxID=1798205 RepID=UPI000BB965C7|nr:hypothetical protein [Cohaesibacter sp. ES.047]SNY91394.1 hypothetical protein SAMN04515647_1616 [Cohaesibacter sp. ES.047]